MQFKATLLGTGTSFGVPVIGCNCAVCASNDPRNRRLRASILVQTDAANVLVDCGPDFREQALRARLERVDCLLLSHAHADHVNGIDDLRIFNFRRQQALDVYCNATTAADLARRFHYLFLPETYEGGRRTPLIELKLFEQPLTVDGIRITPVPALHGELPILGFRFADFAYVTDCKTLPDSSKALLRGLDVLILNALRQQPHPVHLNLDEARQLADELRPRRVFFTHMSHELDHEETNRLLAPRYALAHDGQTFEF